MQLQYQPETVYISNEISLKTTSLVPNEDEGIVRPSNIHSKPHETPSETPTMVYLYQLSVHAVLHFLSTNHAQHDKPPAIPCPVILED